MTAVQRADDGPSEESPLLAHAEHEQLTRSRSPSSRKWRFNVQAAYLITPVMFGTRFVEVLVTTPTIQIVRQVVCRWWLSAHDPNSLPSDGSNPSDELCNRPGITEAFSTAIAVLAVISAAGGIISLGVIGHFAARYGRKPVTLVLVLVIALGTACFLAAVGIDPSPLQDTLLIAWVIIDAFSSSRASALACCMYVVDLTEPNDRTFALSFVSGFAVLGTAPTYWLGGFISSHSSVAIVFWYKFTAIVAIIFYIILVIPESFTKQKREAARLEAERRGRDTSSRQHSTLVSVIRRPLYMLGSILEPLKCLKPTYNTVTGRRNFRLLIIALSQGINYLGTEYIGNAFVVYTTARFHFAQEDLGIALSTYACFQFTVLAAIVPAILRWGRPLYNRHYSRTPSHAQTNGSTDTHIDNVPSGTVTPKLNDEVASHFDVYLAIGSDLVWALALIFMALASSRTTVIFALVLLSLGAGHEPAMKSISVASADPLQSGNMLAALGIVSTIGALLAPIIFGTILNVTITKVPQLVFFLFSLTIFLGGALLFLVRDSDRHVKTSVEEESER